MIIFLLFKLSDVESKYIQGKWMLESLEDSLKEIKAEESHELKTKCIVFYHFIYRI